jgi:hypothetical protein
LPFRCEAPVLMVGTDSDAVERDLRVGKFRCGECDVELRPWGWARWLSAVMYFPN